MIVTQAVTNASHLQLQFNAFLTNNVCSFVLDDFGVVVAKYDVWIGGLVTGFWIFASNVWVSCKVVT